MKAHGNRFILSILIVVLLVPSLLTSSRELNLEVDSPRIGRVIDVIDAEVIKVWYYNSDFEQNEIKLIKLIGVDSSGYLDAYELTLNGLLGSTVYILEDDNSDSFPEVDNLDCEYAYVYQSFDQSFNEVLITAGLAEVDESYVEASMYSDLVAAQSAAMLNGYGIWDENSTEIEPIININVANYSNLEETFEDASGAEIYSIITYRNHNPFNSIEEIKFVDEYFDYDWFEENKEKLSVVTNINAANANELSSLFSSSNSSYSIADQIIDYRIFNSFSNINELNNIATASAYYDTISEYISVETLNYYDDEDIEVANINTCSSDDFEDATALSSFTYGYITDYRCDNIYGIKSINELTVNSNPLSYANSYKFVDNLTVSTDLNNAYTFELMSLFGLYDLTDDERESLAEEIISNRPYVNIEELEAVIGNDYYEDIEPYIYAFSSEAIAYININTADPDYVSSYLKLSDDDEAVYEDYRDDGHTYEAPDDIAFDLTDIGDKFTLYTNVNTASYFELYHLHDDMTANAANAIIDLREEQPITSVEELLDLFIEYEVSSIYSEVCDYLVFY